MASSIPHEDLPFGHYSLKHRIIAWISIHLFDDVSYRVRHGLLKGLKRKGGLGWIPMESTETPESRFWTDCNLSGFTVYDVGSFQGLLAMFFARRAKQVICFEPNTQNHRRLLENLALNGFQNVMVRKTGVGSARGTVTMVGNPLMPGGSSIDAQTVENLKRSGRDAVFQEIPIVTLDEEIAVHQLPPPDFLKIDIEGWELEALRGARETLLRHRPALFLEMHGETIREKKRKVTDIVNFLWEIGYRDIRHVESGRAVTPETALIAIEGHLYCPTGTADS